jgi:Secretory lipase
MTAPLSEGWYSDPSAAPPSALRLDGMAAESLVAPPQDDSFYSYTGNTPLADIAPGTVLKTRTLPYHVLGVPTLLTATQLLYRSTSQTNAPTVNVTSVISPLGQPDKTKVISFQSAYDSLSRNDQPSYAIAGGLTVGGVIPSVESGAFGQLLVQGFTVVVPDTEGQRADFAAGPEYGMNTLDSIRAALSPESKTGLPSDAKIALLGYSGGAIASEWAAELAPTYAPDVNKRLIGAAIGGVLVHPAHNLHYVEGTAVWAGVMPMALIGIARAFGKDFTPYLTDRGRKLYDDMQATSITKVLYHPAFFLLRWSDLVVPEYPTPESLRLFVELANKLIMGTGGTPTIPMFIGQGTAGDWESGTPGNRPGIGAGDGVMIAGDVRTLARSYCAKGLPVQYEQYPLGHIGALGVWLPHAIDWIKDRFAGSPAPTNCASIATGNPLDPIPLP